MPGPTIRFFYKSGGRQRDNCHVMSLAAAIKDYKRWLEFHPELEKEPTFRKVSHFCLSRGNFNYLYAADWKVFATAVEELSRTGITVPPSEFFKDG